MLGYIHHHMWWYSSLISLIKGYTDYTHILMRIICQITIAYKHLFIFLFTTTALGQGHNSFQLWLLNCSYITYMKDECQFSLSMTLHLK